MNVAIYSRKSLETDTGESIKNQITLCKEYFNRIDNNALFEVFEDEGFSGGNTNRPAFQLMLSKAKKKEFDAIVCYKIDRIARNIVDFVNIYASLEKLGIKLISVTESFDTSTPIGKMMLMLIASFAEMERSNIQQRVKDNMKELAKSGKWSGGTTPLGYINVKIQENGKNNPYLKLDNDKAALVQEIYDYYINCKSMHQVQKWLFNDKNIKYCMSTIKNILTSPVYVKANTKVLQYLSNFGEVYGETNGISGILSYNRRPYSNGVHRWNDKNMFYAISKHEGIIDADKWLLVQSLQEKTKNSPRPKNSQVSYFTNVLRCDKCSSPMTISYNHKNIDNSVTYVYLCTGRKTYGKEYCNCSQIKQSDLDSKIKETINSYSTLDFTTFKSIFGNNNYENIDNEISKLNKKIAANEARINNLVDKLSEMTNEEGKPFMNKIKMLTKENEELRKELIFKNQEKINTQTIPIENIYDNFKTLPRILDSDSSIDVKREIVNFTFKEIRYSSDLKDINIII